MPDNIVCPVCLKSKRPALTGVWKSYKLFLCDQCDVIFSHPFKAHGFDWYESDENYNVSRLSKTLYWHHKQFLSEPPQGQTLIDVGCNNGVFLSFAEKLGYKVTGLDFNKRAIEAGKQAFGLKRLYSFTLGEFAEQFPRERFDVITAFEILEHLDNPNRFIKEIKGLLKPKGCLCISVPNREMAVNPLGETDYPPHHLTKWSARALKNFLNSHGFSIVSHRIKNVATEDMARWFDYNFMRKIDYAVRRKLREKAVKKLEDKWLEGNAKTLPLLVRMRHLEINLLRGLFLPVTILLRMMGKQGFGQYVQTRLD